jgi:crotonobetainyl-CoA hydratase
MLPELQRGFLPDVGGYQWLTRKLPINVAMEMILTGRRMEAEEAQRWGLVHRIVPRSELKAAAFEMAERIAIGAPLAIRALKAIVRATHHVAIAEALGRAKTGRSGVPVFEQMLASEDFVEGPRAFAEKRPPVWKGK